MLSDSKTLKLILKSMENDTKHCVFEFFQIRHLNKPSSPQALFKKLENSRFKRVVSGRKKVRKENVFTYAAVIHWYRS